MPNGSGTEFDELQKDLLKDISQASKSQEAAPNAIGVSRSRRIIKTVRVGRRVLGQAEISRVDQLMKQASRELSSEATQLETAERDKMEARANQQLNNFKEVMLKRQLAFQQRMSQLGIDSRRQQAMMGLFGKVAGSIGGALISGVGGGSGDTRRAAQPGEFEPGFTPGEPTFGGGNSGDQF